MTSKVILSVVKDLGRDWLWLEDAGVILIDGDLSVGEMAGALEAAAALLRLEDARIASGQVSSGISVAGRK